jgi:hypothetical protein
VRISSDEVLAIAVNPKSARGETLRKLGIPLKQAYVHGVRNTNGSGALSVVTVGDLS